MSETTIYRENEITNLQRLRRSSVALTAALPELPPGNEEQGAATSTALPIRSDPSCREGQGDYTERQVGQG